MLPQQIKVLCIRTDVLCSRRNVLRSGSHECGSARDCCAVGGICAPAGPHNQHEHRKSFGRHDSQRRRTAVVSELFV